MANIKEISVPDIGDIESADVLEVLVASGDSFAAGDSLVSLESDKASMEVPATASGVVVEVKVAAGDAVSEGTVILTFEPSEAKPAEPEPKQAEAPKPEPPKQEAPKAPAEEAPKPKPTRPAPPDTKTEGSRKGALSHASPSVRRYARELGADLSQIKGTGRKGRITKDDVKAYIKRRLSQPAGGGGGALPEMPAVDFSKFGEVDEIKLSRIRKISAKTLHRSWLHVPHVTQHDEADITEMEAFRKANKEAAAKKGFKMTPLVFLMKAVVAGLKEYPDFNSSLSPDGESLIRKHYYHLGIAVDTPNGLVVPVVRDVDKKSLYELAADLGELSGKARDGKLMPADMQGACFTISSLGGIGGTAFTPIVNAPEVAILGVSRSSMKPVWNGGEFQPRLMLPLSLSYDHRVIDGAAAARFTTFLGQMLGDIRRLLL